MTWFMSYHVISISMTFCYTVFDCICMFNYSLCSSIATHFCGSMVFRPNIIPFKRSATLPVCGRNTRNEAEQREATQEWVHTPVIFSMSRCHAISWIFEIRSPNCFLGNLPIDLSVHDSLGVYSGGLSWCFQIMKSVPGVEPRYIGWPSIFEKGHDFSNACRYGNKDFVSQMVAKLFNWEVCIPKKQSLKALLDLKNHSPIHFELWHFRYLYL